MPNVGSRRVVATLVLLVSLALVPSFALAGPLGFQPAGGSTITLTGVLAELWGSLTGLWLASTDPPPPTGGGGTGSEPTDPPDDDDTKNVIDPNGVDTTGGSTRP